MKLKQQLELTALLLCIAILSAALFLFPEEERRNEHHSFLELWWSNHSNLSINKLDSVQIFSLPISEASKRSLWFRRKRNWPFKDFNELCTDPYLIKDSLFFSLGSYSFQPNFQVGQKLHPFHTNSLKQKMYPRKSEAYSSVDLNQADSIALDNIPGIGSGMVKVLKAYRSRYGFIADTSHLRKTTYFGKVWREEWDSLLRIDSIPAPKLSLVSSTFQELLAFPDLNYEQVKRLCFYRESFGIPTWLEMASWNEFSEADTTFLQLYISNN